MRGGVDALGKAARDDPPARRERSRELKRKLLAADRRTAAADHGERRIFERVEVPRDIKSQGAVVVRTQHPGILRSGARHQVMACVLEPAQLGRACRAMRVEILTRGRATPASARSASEVPISERGEPRRSSVVASSAGVRASRTQAGVSSRIGMRAVSAKTRARAAQVAA
jgi:hypothetical protein